jgi:hypothetical protein
MARSLKVIGPLVIAFGIIGVMSNALGLVRSNDASTESSQMIRAVTISPEELTRAAAAMPVQEIENYQ